MYNAALVIGVGGTGRWVCTHLRARLLGDAGPIAGEQPASTGAVRLLSLDVDSENEYAFAGHSLEPHELYFPNPKIADIINNIRDFDVDDPQARWPEYRQWISQEDAQAYELSLLTEFLKSGAGQMRQWGRLSILERPEFLARIGELMGELSRGGGVEIYLVGSLCGGTGSATLFDAAAAVHHARSTYAPNVPVQLIGAFLLPRGFTHSVKAGEFQWLEACGFAALRELDRFQRVDSGNQIQQGQESILLTRRLFDLCYLLDGVREGAQVDGQDLVNNEAADGVHAALADLIYDHLHPALSGALAASYVNVVNHLGGPHPHKHSKFGTFTVLTPMQLVHRSLALDEAAAVVELLRQSDRIGEEGTAVTVTPKITFTDEAEQSQTAYNASVLTQASRLLGGRRIPPPNTTAILEWLAPTDRDQRAIPPTRPNFRSEYPEVGKLRTPYQNPDVKKRVDELAETFAREMTKTIERNRATLLATFRLYLLAQCTRIMADPSSAGGLSRASAALSEVSATLKELQSRLGRLFKVSQQSGKAGQAERTYRDSQDAMDDNRTWDDAIEQRDLFDAADQVIQARLESTAQAALLDLLDTLQQVTREVLTDQIEGWQKTLVSLAEDLGAASAQLDRAWEDYREVKVRRVVLDRHSPLEQAQRQLLTEEVRKNQEAGSAQQIGSPADALVQRLDWRLGVTPGSDDPAIKIVVPFADPQPVIRAGDLVRPFEVQYEFVLGLGLQEALDSATETDSGYVSALASMIATKSTLLAEDAQERVSPGQPLPMATTYIFGPWGSASGALAQLRTAIDQLQLPNATFVDTLALVAADAQAATGVPLKQQVTVLSTTHGSSLDGFAQTAMLRDRYLRLRHDKPLHIFPEERAALAIEETMARAVKEGLKLPVERLEGQAVILARESLLLKQILVLLAAKKLIWTKNPVKNTGEWTLNDGATPEVVAEGADPAALLDRVLGLGGADDDPQGVRTRTSLLAAAGEVPFPYTAEVSGGLKALSREGVVDGAALSTQPAVVALMRTLAWQLVQA